MCNSTSIAASGRSRRRAASQLATRSLILAALAAAPLAGWPSDAGALTAIEELGKNVFFDTNLSRPRGKQACASCHDPARGWVLPLAAINRHIVAAPGAVPGAFGSFKTPANAYATFVPAFRSSVVPFLAPWLGGVFWDGRAEGCGKTDGSCPVGSGTASATIRLADLPPAKQAAYGRFLGPTADQALNPFPNPVEQNIPIDEVCREVQFARYRVLYPVAFGERIDCGAIPTIPGTDRPALVSFKRLAVAIAAWQASREVNSFSSKRDVAIRSERDGQFPLRGFTDQENLGHDLFYGVESILNPRRPDGTLPSGNCASCHNGVPEGQAADTTGVAPQQLYTDSRYHNIGVPFNREIPGVPKLAKLGLKSHEASVGRGLFKTPTVRNVAKGLDRRFTKAFTHNGWFKSLESLVHFYNTRDALGRCEALPNPITDATEAEALANNCWPKPEFGEIVPLPSPPDDVRPAPTFGRNGLTTEQELAIVAYLRTLSDRVTPRRP